MEREIVMMRQRRQWGDESGRGSSQDLDEEDDDANSGIVSGSNSAISSNSGLSSSSGSSEGTLTKAESSEDGGK